MSTTYTYTGSEQQHSVSSGTDAVRIKCYGAQGGHGENKKTIGGEGGYAEGVLSTSGGETLYVYVGEQPPTPSWQGSSGRGGWNGGGDGGPLQTIDSPPGGGGGGADVRVGGNTTGDRIIVAGGGGGGGGYGQGNGGAGGGTQGADGGGATGGTGGTQTSGGSINGSSFSGGQGATNDGGGGGGWYGGGGGQNDGTYDNSGGGGGSAYTDSSLSSTSVSVGGTTGHGQVVIEELQQPASPNNVSATVNADDSITVSWDTDTSAGTPTEYNIEMSRDGTTYTPPADVNTVSHSSGTTSYSVTLNPVSDNAYDAQVGIDSSFKFRVNATNSVGTSSWSTSGTVYTDPIPPHTPSASRSGGNSITISWSNQSGIENGVEVQYREDSGSGYGAWSTVTTTAAGATSWSTSTLPNDARRQWRIRTVGTGGKTSRWVFADYGNNGNVFFSDSFESGGLGNWTSTSLGDADSGVYSGTNAPTGDAGISGADDGTYYAWLESGDTVTKDLGDLSAESNVIVKAALAAGSMDSGSERVGINWYDGSAWNELHKLYWEYNKQGWVEVTASVPSSWLSTDNRIRLTGYGGTGDYAAFDRVVVSDVLHEYTTPAAHSGLGFDTSTEDQISVTWVVNATFYNRTDMGWKPTSATSYTTTSNVTTPHTISSLKDGEKYDVYVRPIRTQYRHGNYDTEFYQDTAGTATALLPAPTSLSVDAVNGDNADLSWTPNHDYGNQRVEVKPTDASTWSDDSGELTKSASTYTTTSLLDGEKYDARVVAYTEHTETIDS